MPESSLVLAAALLALIPCAYAGVALIATGLGRSRGAAHSIYSASLAVAVSFLSTFLCGAAFTGTPGGPAHAFLAGGKSMSWLGAGAGFLSGVVRDEPRTVLVALFTMLAAGLASMIPVGAGAERWRLVGVCCSAAITSAIAFPLIAHATLMGGWLAQLGYGDVSGAAAVQALGGLTAIVIATLLGPRKGKYSGKGMPAAIPGHNTVFVVLGAAIALVGWIGLNGSAAVLLAGASLSQVFVGSINTVLATSGGLLGAAILTRVRFGKPDASLGANGWVCALAASSGSAPFVAPPQAILTGLIAGVLVVFVVEWLELHFRIDDPAGAIATHGVGGFWGMLATGLFARFPESSQGHLVGQLIGIAALILIAGPIVWGLNLALNRLVPYRISPEGEHQGIDLHELGSNAYPELAGHLDDFMPR